MQYGDGILLHDGSQYSLDKKRKELSYLDPQTGRFSKPLGPKTPVVDVLATAWTLVDSSNLNSTAVFTGGAFSLR